MAPYFTGFLLCFVMAAFTGLCSGECELPNDQDTPLVKKYNECAESSGKNRLCLLKCYSQSLGVVTDDGTVTKEKLNEYVDMMEDGEFKEATKVYCKKCFKDGEQVDLKKSNCLGFVKMGKCIQSTLKKKCPKVAKTMGL